jgi:hypothetical protein
VEVLRQEGKEEKVPKLLWHKDYQTPALCLASAKKTTVVHKI